VLGDLDGVKAVIVARRGAAARTWADTYYDIIRSDSCVPVGHAVNANIRRDDDRDAPEADLPEV
jgi:hypothetical protein